MTLNQTEDKKQKSLSKCHKEILEKLVLSNAYGGFEGKVEDGRIVHFKHWISQKWTDNT